MRLQDVFKKTASSSSGFDVFIEVDLEEMFGTSVDSDLLKIEIGQAVADTIRERTRTGRFRRGPTTYSPAYAERTGSTNPVDLTLTGSMLDELQVISVGDSTVTVGFTTSTNQTKAHGHDQNVGGPPQREFMYVTRAEMSSLVDEFDERVESSGTDELVNRFLDSLEGI